MSNVPYFFYFFSPFSAKTFWQAKRAEIKTPRVGFFYVQVYFQTDLSANIILVCKTTLNQGH